jgi:hypothetical protein
METFVSQPIIQNKERKEEEEEQEEKKKGGGNISPLMYTIYKFSYPVKPVLIQN